MALREVAGNPEMSFGATILYAKWMDETPNSN